VARLDPRRFVRVHRTHIVNLDQVRAFRRDARGKPGSGAARRRARAVVHQRPERLGSCDRLRRGGCRGCASPAVVRANPWSGSQPAIAALGGVHAITTLDLESSISYLWFPDSSTVNLFFIFS
jgi:hypothetical protein